MSNEITLGNGSNDSLRIPGMIAVTGAITQSHYLPITLNGAVYRIMLAGPY